MRLNLPFHLQFPPNHPSIHPIAAVSVPCPFHAHWGLGYLAQHVSAGSISLTALARPRPCISGRLRLCRNTSTTPPTTPMSSSEYLVSLYLIFSLLFSYSRQGSTAAAAARCAGWSATPLTVPLFTYLPMYPPSLPWASSCEHGRSGERPRGEQPGTDILRPPKSIPIITYLPIWSLHLPPASSVSRLPDSRPRSAVVVHPGASRPGSCRHRFFPVCDEEAAGGQRSATMAAPADGFDPRPATPAAVPTATDAADNPSVR